jgi:hypothetical protein
MAHKEVITFEDLDGNEVTEEWYFSLAESDIAELPFMHDENLDEVLTGIAKKKDSHAWMEILKMVILASVGKREDNLLVKDAKTKRQFEYGGAYREFFSKLITAGDAGYGFFQSTLPPRLLKQIEVQENREYTKDEMLAMSEEEFVAAFGSDEKKYSQEVLLVAFQRRNNSAA